MIKHTNGSDIEEGVYLGLAEKAGTRYLVLGQMQLECVTLLVRTGTDKSVTTGDALFGKVLDMPGKLVDTAWARLGRRVYGNSVVGLDGREHESGMLPEGLNHTTPHIIVCICM
jgi:flagellar biosynthesis/type III secretory pathway ATPase